MEQEYVVIKHPIPHKSVTYPKNTRFINGWGVFLKNSIPYNYAKRIDMLKKRWLEYPIEYLCLTKLNIGQIELLFGKNVKQAYTKRMAELREKGITHIDLEQNARTYLQEMERKKIELGKKKRAELERIVKNKEKIDPRLFEKELEHRIIQKELSDAEKECSNKEEGLCIFVKKNGIPCTNKATRGNYCFGHLRWAKK